MGTKDFGYVFEKPAFIKDMEKQQRIIDDMMRPYKELSGMYSGMNTLLTSLQANNKVFRMEEEISALTKIMTDPYRMSIAQFQQPYKDALDILYNDNSGWRAALDTYNNMFDTHKDVFRTFPNVLGEYNWDALIGAQKMVEPFTKNLGLYSNACMLLASVLKVAFPEEEISFDDVDFSFGSDGSITINGTTYKEEEIPQAVEEQVQKIKKWTISDIKESYETFKRNHALLFFIMRIAYVLLTFPPTVQVGIQFYQTAVQEIGMYLNGWDEWYYINNENGVAIYQEPSTESPVLMRATYSNPVRKTEDTKFWIKVQYSNSEVEDGYIEGWIAKRNLIPYADVEFDGDDAVCDN